LQLCCSSKHLLYDNSRKHLDFFKKHINEQARTPCALGTGMNCLQIFVIARLDRAIQRIELDSPVKPENDSIEFLSFTPCAFGAGFLTDLVYSLL